MSVPLKSIIRRALNYVRRTNPGEIPASHRGFYALQPTCQIANLDHLFAKYLGEKVDGQYVEVGAYDGVFVSNTWGLAQKGWGGVLIEPISSLAQLCRDNYADKPKVKVIEAAVGAPGIREVLLYVAGTLTTANSETFTEYSNVDWAVHSLTNNKITVPCFTLNEILNSHRVDAGFDLLVVDVEGYETEVFEGFDLQKFRPRMMIVELADTHPDLTTTSNKDAALSTFILEREYRIVYKDAINTVFVRKDVWESTHRS